LRQVDGRSVLVGVAKDKFPWFEWRAGAGRWYVVSAFNDWLREPIAVTEVVVCSIEWRDR
jgi:hypothetical protein